MEFQARIVAFNLRELNSNTIFLRPPREFQSSLPRSYAKFIVGAPQEWLNLCAELLRVGSSFVRIERLAVLQTSTR